MGDEEPVEIYADKDKTTTDMCSAACVSCNGDGDESWTLTQSIACLVASGCVVLPPEDWEEAVAAERPKPKAPAPPPPKPAK